MSNRVETGDAWFGLVSRCVVWASEPNLSFILKIRLFILSSNIGRCYHWWILMSLTALRTSSALINFLKFYITS
jgi:hypothetical protein